MDRREFLRLGAMGAGAAMLSGCDFRVPIPRPGRGPIKPVHRSVLDASPSLSGIDTVVICMMENRSFDSYFGWLARDEQFIEQGLSRYGRNFTVNGDSHQVFQAPDGELVETFRRSLSDEANNMRGCGFSDPGHGWDHGRAQRDGGFLAEGSRNDEFALSYFEENDLPFYNLLARRFTVCDQWHASILGPTYPNREYLLSGQSGGYKTNYLPIAEGGFQWETIMDRLAAANVPIAEYYSDLPPFLLFGSRMAPYLRAYSRFAEDAAAGTLPTVSFVSPSFGGGNRTDDHPHGDPRAAQMFVRDTFAALARGPQWEHSLFVLVYDEWGGFFDHVAPPLLPDLRPSTDDQENFAQAGFRIPAVLASPYALPGFVDHMLYDHTSILRFLEWRFLGAPPRGSSGRRGQWWLTPRDRYAHNAGEFLVRGGHDVEVGFDLDVDIAQPEPPCPEDATAQTIAFTDDELTPFEIAYNRGYYDRLGVAV
jgi:phospholipase C